MTGPAPGPRFRARIERALPQQRLIEQNDEWLVGRRYLSESSLALVITGDQADQSVTTASQEVGQLTAS